jgi:hypothetical protein
MDHAYSPNSRSISAVNTVLNPGVTSQVDALSAHYSVEFDQLVSHDLVGDQIAAFIAAFASSRGYATDVVPQDVIDLVQNSILALSILGVMKRSMDAANLTNSVGQEVKQLFTVTQKNLSGASETSMINNMIDQLAIESAALEDYSFSISNTVWQQDYLSELGQLYLPEKLAKLVYYITTNVFESRNTSIDSIVYNVLWPTITRGEESDDLNVLFLSTMSTINTALAAKTDLRVILTELGMSSVHTINLDWDRDIKGQTLRLVNDANLMYMLGQAYPEFGEDWPILSDTYWANTIADPNISGSTFGFNDQIELDFDKLSLLFNMRGKVRALSIATHRADSDIEHIYLLPIELAAFSNGAVDAPDNEVKDLQVRLALTTYYSQSVLPHHAYGLIRMDVDWDSGVWGASVSISETNALGGSNVYKFNDFTLYRSIAETETLYGVGYRKKLQTKIAGYRKVGDNFTN